MSVLGQLSLGMLVFGIAANLLMAVIWIAFPSTQRRADLFTAAMHVALASTSCHLVLISLDVFDNYPDLLFLPVYWTLAIGPFMFFSIKLRLFPKYKFVPSDIKHFILPVGQFLYFALLFIFAEIGFRQELGRKFYSPFYGGLEMAIFITTFNIYLAASYRFIKFKIAQCQRIGDASGLQTVLQLRRMLRVVFILFFFNSVYIFTDFIMYEVLGLNMHNYRTFTHVGEMLFASLATWMAWASLAVFKHWTYRSFSDRLWQWIKTWLLKRQGLEAKKNVEGEQ